MKDKILVFIPMYNCEKQIGRVIDQLVGEIKPYISEAIIVNNRSTDNGEQVVLEKLKNLNTDLSIKLLRNNENYGLGGSHKVAFKYAIENNFDYIIVLHGDDQGNIADFIPLLKNQVHKKYDCCLGARFMKESKILGYSIFRTFGNKVYNLIFSIFLGKRIYDLGSGLNCYNVNLLKSNFFHKFADNLTFNCYMLLAVNYYKQNINFFPVSWREEDQISNVKMINQALTTLLLVTKYFFIRGKYLNSEHRKKIIDSYNAIEISR